MKIIKFIFAEIKKINVIQILFVVFFATAFLSFVAYFKPSHFSWVYNEVDPSLVSTYFFDIFVRNGWFMPLYFLFSSLLFIFIAQFILIKFGKKSYPLGIKTNLGLFIVAVLVSFSIYSAMPYYVPDIKSLNLEVFELRDEVPEASMVETTADFCGKRVDFFFSPSEGFSLRAKQVVSEDLEPTLPVPVNYQCVATSFNDMVLCEREFGLHDWETSGVLLREWTRDVARPSLVLGCKHAIRGIYTVDAYMEVVCEKMPEICD